ncbi:MAG TPA: GDCCVxC domain-containing (seleno)protein [Chitinophagaceae bacterium]|nr:GDCCVxC domain-containing (seleno)protein [Chitinophagaceae bacterium]
MFIKLSSMSIITISIITCPFCNHKEEKVMPTNACEYFYSCEKCQKLLQPKKGDCCVYCSYGTVVCPPIQVKGKCC